MIYLWKGWGNKMRRFTTVFLFELKSYMKNKSVLASTIIIALVIGLALFAPRVIDMSDMLGTTKEEVVEEDTSDAKDDEEEKEKYGIIDPNVYFKDKSLLEQFYGDVEFIDYSDEKAMKDDLEKETITSGFIVEDDSHYRYLVWNNHMFSDGAEKFHEAMTLVHKQIYCQQNNLNFEEFMAGYDAPVEFEQEILGKDASDNYWYSYALVMVIFMIIILYCVMIATSVTSEKSNRAIEVLVTSIDSKFLLFGKVLAGATAAILQV